MSANVLSIIELESLMIRFEGCLNSRPLAIQSDDPNDHVVVTPVKLLTGHAWTVILHQLNLIWTRSQLPISIIERFNIGIKIFGINGKLTTKNNLQCRGRWQNKQPNLKVNNIVLIMEDNLAPQHWIMRKIIEVHPGRDDCVRNVTIKCGNGSTFKRAIQKLCKFPVAQDVMATKP